MDENEFIIRTVPKDMFVAKCPFCGVRPVPLVFDYGTYVDGHNCPAVELFDGGACLLSDWNIRDGVEQQADTWGASAVAIQSEASP